MNNEDKSKDSGGVEVVADQAEDGSYEFRVERARRRAKESESADAIKRESPRSAKDGSSNDEEQAASASSVWRAEGEEAGDDGARWSSRRMRKYLFSAALVILLSITGGAVISSMGSENTPKTVEIDEPAFQGVFVETPPLVVDEMAIVEQSDASDTSDDAVEEQPELEGQATEEGQLAPPTQQRNADEPVIDDIVKSALDNVAEEDERADDKTAADEGEEGYEDEPSPSEEDESDPYDEDEYYEDEGDEPYPDDEYEDEYYDEEPYYDDELPPEEGTEDY